MIENNQSEIIIYQTDDGQTRIQTRMQDETIWLTQAHIAELFQKSVATINEHIKHIYAEGELEESATLRNFRIVQTEGSREVSREVNFYNLDVIISVGYRVRSHRGTQFRTWATARLREYLVKGFVLDEVRLERGATDDYFDALVKQVTHIADSSSKDKKEH